MEPTHTVVTGGASGIGRAVVEDLLARGERVTVFDLEPGSDPVPGFVAVDITEEEAVAEAFDQATARAGVVQRLVASAGTRGEFVPALKMDPGRMRRVLEVNVLGTFIPAREMVRRLEGRGGSIVALSSTTAYRGWAKQADYGTSKAAVASLVEHLAVEWAPLGVRVNAVAPGHTLTPMVEAMVATGYDLTPVRERTPLAKLATPAEMAAEITHLLIESTHVTGQCLAVDGGWTAVGK